MATKLIDNYQGLNPNRLLAWGLGLCYAVGVLNTAHYEPYTTFPGESVAAFVLALTVAMIMWVLPLRVMALSALTWFGLALLIILQPAINTIIYVDTLVFPVFALLLVGVMAVCVYNLTDKPMFIQHLAVIVLLVGFLCVVIQCVQLLVATESLPWWVSMRGEWDPPYANLNQRNIAAYVLSMTVVALFYVYYRWRLALVWLLIGVFVLAVGNGLTTSRGGVILQLVAIFVMVFFGEKIKKTTLSVGVLLVAVLGYQLGVSLVGSILQFSGGAERIVTDSISGRLNLLYQAWLIFKENIFTGIGWGNYAIGGLNNIEHIEMFRSSTHAHSLFPQIAAELGLLGLVITLPVVVVIVSMIRLNLPNDKLFAFGIVVLTALYSFSEFPLWFFYFLAIATACVACLDNKPLWKIRIKINAFLMGLVVLIAGGAIFYLDKYYDIAHTPYLWKGDYYALSREEKHEIYNQQEFVFGFSGAKEAAMFELLAISEEQIAEKIILGERVVSTTPTPNNLMMLAQLYVLNDDSRALPLFKAACLYEAGIYCSKINSAMKQLQIEYQGGFIEVAKQYFKWLEEEKMHSNNPKG